MSKLPDWAVGAAKNTIISILVVIGLALGGIILIGFADSLPVGSILRPWFIIFGILMLIAIPYAIGQVFFEALMHFKLTRYIVFALIVLVLAIYAMDVISGG